MPERARQQYMKRDELIYLSYPVKVIQNIRRINDVLSFTGL
jgi:hypothetical protein